MKNIKLKRQREKPRAQICQITKIKQLNLLLIEHYDIINYSMTLAYSFLHEINSFKTLKLHLKIIWRSFISI